MPTTSVYALPYPAPVDPADVPVDMQELAERIVLVLGGALSATPPASPFEGQLWATQPSAGVTWMFRYDAAAASNKWEYVGGPPLFAEVVTEEAINTTAYADPTTAGPQLTVPRAGDYLATFGARWYTGTAGSQTAWMAVKRGAATAVDADGVDSFLGTSLVPSTLSRELPLSGLAAATVLKAQYRLGAAGATHYFAKRWLRVLPLRVS